MKIKIQNTLTAIVLFLTPTMNFAQAQAPDLGTAANFALFSTDEAVSNSGTSYLTRITGNVGSNGGPVSGFGNVNGQMHTTGLVAGECAADLLVAYNQLDTTTANFFPVSPILGNGDTLVAGVYSIPSAASLELNLFLNAEGNPDAVFIFQIQGTFGAATNSKINLINEALACNVFWKVNNAVNILSGATIRGTIISGGAISLNTGDTLEGRALTVTGAITIAGTLVYTPIGCGSPILTGPTAPILGAVACYALFSSDDDVTNMGVTNVTGDIGTNFGVTSGYDDLLVTGVIHDGPDGSTGTCSADLGNVYTYLDTMDYDIKLGYPAEFGHDLILTPHTYWMASAVDLTDTLYLNAEGNPDAVFVIQITGAFAATVNSKIILINDAQAKNVYWKIGGAVNIYNNSIFIGTIVATGEINLYADATLNGRVLTVSGKVNTNDNYVDAPMIPGNCTTVGISALDAAKQEVTIAPNPFTTSTNIIINNESLINKTELRLYNSLGAEVLNTIISKQATNLETNNLPAGLYFYKLTEEGRIIQSGKLISQ